MLEMVGKVAAPALASHNMCPRGLEERLDGLLLLEVPRGRLELVGQ